MHTTAEVARAAGVSAWTLYEAIRAGRVIPPARVGKSIIWGDTDKAKVVEFFAARKARRGAKS